MKKITLPLLLLSVHSLWASDAELDHLIVKTRENSLALQASKESVKAAELETNRSQKHWLPQLYLTGQSFVTNDPGAALFGTLSQRKIESTDFMPDKLNHPKSELYSKAALGLNIPLYEGGMKLAITKAMSHAEDAKKSEDQSVKTQFYTEVVKNYISAKELLEEKSQLESVQSMIESIVKKYEIGSKSNLVGYSGLLGLKSLHNRLKAYLDENNAKLSATHGALRELSGQMVEVKLDKDSDSTKLMKEYLQFEEKYKISASVQSYFQNAQSAKEIIEAEKSRNLPRLGIFGEGYAMNGERATGKGFSTGLYLNWNLFSSNDLGASAEATHKSKAAQYFAEASAQKEKMEYDGLLKAKDAVLHSLLLLDESEKYLEEQTKISHQLFKNGLINALQYTEVLSRRVDLIKSKSQAMTELLNIQSELSKLSDFQYNQGSRS